MVGGTDKERSARQVAFGDRVRHHRQRLGWSQETLAYEADINRSYIASLEGGRRNPSLDLMARLAAALGVDLSELVKGLQAKKGRS